MADKNAPQMYVPGGMDDSIRGTDVAKFSVTEDNWINLACLTDVKYTQNKAKKEGDNTLYDNLVFIFRGADYIKDGDVVTVPLLMHSEGAKLKGSDKHTAKDFSDWQAGLFAHIFNTFKGHNAHVMENGGKGLGHQEGEPSWANYFKSIEKSFNEGKTKTITEPAAKAGDPPVEKKINYPIYHNEKGIPMKFWIKLTYNDEGNLQLPLFNNSLELYTEGKNPVLLSKNVKYDKFSVQKKERKAKASSTLSSSSGVAAGDLPPGF